MVCAEYTRLAVLCRPNLTVFLHQPGKRTAVGDKLAHLLRLAVRRFRLANHRLQRRRRLQLMGERSQPVGELQDLLADAALLPAAHVGKGPVQPVAAGLIAIKRIQQIIVRLVLKRTLRQQPAGQGLYKAGDMDRLGEGQGVSITRTSTVPNCGLGRISQCRSFMLSIMLV